MAQFEIIKLNQNEKLVFIFFTLKKKKETLGKLDQNDINLYLYFTFLVFHLTWKLKQNTSVQHYNGCKIRHAVNLDLDRDMAAVVVARPGPGVDEVSLQCDWTVLAY